jgi:hypothetical protein
MHFAKQAYYACRIPNAPLLSLRGAQRRGNLSCCLCDTALSSVLYCSVFFTASQHFAKQAYCACRIQSMPASKHAKLTGGEPDMALDKFGPV